MPNKLKPCPFCGGEAELIDIFSEDSNKENVFFVQCKNIWKGCKVLAFTHDYLTAEEAIEAWNRRAGEE